MTSARALRSLWDMLHVYGDAFVNIVNHLSHMAGMIEHQGVSTPNAPLGKKPYSQLTGWVEKLAGVLEYTETPATRAAVRDALRLLQDPETGCARIGAALDQIMSRFHAELEGKDLMLMSAEETRLFVEANDGFGKAVADAFPTAVEDISEASKCAAFHRFTASVFHLMRAMECAVQALSAKLEIEPGDLEWGKLLSAIDEKIKAMPKGDRKDTWSETRSNLYHVKQAWRNKTMHPKRTYTGEEAHGVYTAVRSFMRHLAPLVS